MNIQSVQTADEEAFATSISILQCVFSPGDVEVVERQLSIGGTGDSRFYLNECA